MPEQVDAEHGAIPEQVVDVPVGEEQQDPQGAYQCCPGAILQQRPEQDEEHACDQQRDEQGAQGVGQAHLGKIAGNHRHDRVDAK